MDLNLFDEKSPSNVKPVIQNVDADKFQKIALILSDKRKLLEEKITTAGLAALGEDKTELRDLIEEMRTFGIGEADYQKYIIEKKHETAPLF